MVKSFRFIDESYTCPSQNMALDEALIENFQNDELPILRFYTWDKDAFTLGRFQNILDIKNFENFGENFTRRTTGGGLLLHGFDLSYSLIIPTSLLTNKSVKESYEYLCQFLLHFYTNLGFEASFAKEIMSNKLSKSAFCQVGYEPYDIIIKGKKVGGNAQRRTKKFIYQHGSIPLHVDSRIFSSVSLEELGRNLHVKEVKELLKSSFETTFNTKLLFTTLNDTQLQSFETLHVNKYNTKEWKYESISAKP